MSATSQAPDKSSDPVLAQTSTPPLAPTKTIIIAPNLTLSDAQITTPVDVLGQTQAIIIADNC